MVGRMLVPLTVALVFGLARRYMPVRPSRKDDYVSDSDDRIDNGSASTVSVYGATFLMMLIIAFAGHALLVWLNHEFALADGPAGLRLFPERAIWWFLPGFAAMSLAYEGVVQLWSLTAGRASVESFDRMKSEEAGFDSRRLLRWMALFIVLPIGFFTMLALPEHVSLGPEAIFERGYGFKATQVFRYADARRFTAIDGYRNRDGSLLHRPALVLNFADGRSWSSADWGDFEKAVDPALTEFLVAKTGLSVEKRVTSEDIGN